MKRTAGAWNVRFADMKRGSATSNAPYKDKKVYKGLVFEIDSVLC